MSITVIVRDPGVECQPTAAQRRAGAERGRQTRVEPAIVTASEARVAGNLGRGAHLVV